MLGAAAAVAGMAAIGVSKPPVEDKKSYVVAGAVLVCNLGTQPTRLKMPLSHGVTIKGKAQMNVNDFVVNENIFPFGYCMSTINPEVQQNGKLDINGVKKAPCVPVITNPWLNGQHDVLIENAPALLNEGCNFCIHGGAILIDNDGQNLSGTTIVKSG
ncbi:hypothetical protein PAECIP111893_01799 [Paenibacillus plantiphilus]|uniref:DUF4280 domain-containing protein n=1 Tax=Paenibacillus plantiphilus TaxID=2905650 RepID=A0ABM9C303_9BACL|nr:hypothetical protein PAECIP111893_01799 [Paenibacillus plantiphilus]